MLGRTGIRVPLLSMGTGGYKCLGQRAESPYSESEILALLRSAFDMGLTFFDTGPGYQDSEVFLGKFFKEIPRDQFAVSTKLGLIDDREKRSSPVASAAEIVEAVETSLRRMQIDAVDLFLMASTDVNAVDMVINEQMPVLEKLKEQGKIRFIGSSEISGADGAHLWLQAALQHDFIDAVMVGHNMLNQSAQKTVFPTCLERDLGAINIYTVRQVFNDGQRIRQVVAELQERGVLADEVDAEDPFGWLLRDGDVSSTVEAAYRHAAYTPGVSTVVCGSISADKIRQNIQWVEKGPLAAEDLQRLQALFGGNDEVVGN
tara:strand:- start:1743 stop:2693 length:951 start_codon:yes stop_codon:yes gene_type:complete